MEDNYYLELSEDEFIKFDPVNALTNVKNVNIVVLFSLSTNNMCLQVFFDDTKKQIFCIKSNSVLLG